jgi:hypothetical protein
MGNLVNQHVRFIESGEKDPLMTYEKALVTQAGTRIVRGSTNRKEINVYKDKH